jgi:hypothetical protein
MTLSPVCDGVKRILAARKAVLINIVSCTVSVALLIIMATTIDFSKKTNEEIDVQDITQSTIKIETSIFSEKIPLINNAIFYYLNTDNGWSWNEGPMPWKGEAF